MPAPVLRDSFRSRWGVLAIALAASACAAPKPVAKTIAPAPSASAAITSAAVTPSGWRAVPIPPTLAPALDGWGSPEGWVVLDDSGVRWLFPSNGTPPTSVSVLDLEWLEQHTGDDARAVRHHDADGRLFGLASALGPLVPLGRVPPGIATPKVLGGGLTVQTPKAVLASREGTTWRTLVGPPGLDLVDALIDARGHGLAILVGGKTVLTHDDGKSWEALPLERDGALSLRPRDGRALVLRAREGADAVDVSTGKASPAHGRHGTRADEEIDEARGRIDDTLRIADGGPASTATGDPDFMRDPRRLALASGRHTAANIALDGDRFLALALGEEEGEPTTKPLMVGRLGEGALAFGGKLPQGCQPHAGALCGADVAVACGASVVVLRDGAVYATLSNATASALAFADEHTLLAASSGGRGKRPSITSYTLGEGSAPTPTMVKDIDFTGERFVGGCHRPASWLVGGGRAARWTPTGLEASAPLPPVSRGGAVNASGELVVATGGRLHFLPSGATVSPGPLDTSDAFAFAEDGRHGLALLEASRLTQTDDGGRTWAEIASPRSRSITTLLCGKDRCQLGSGAYREGFVRDPAFVPSAPPRAASKAAASPVTTLVCRRDPTIFAGAAALDQSVSPRTGALLFAGLAGVPEPNVRPKSTKVTAVFGSPDGRATAVDLAAAVLATYPTGKPDPPADGEMIGRFTAGGVGLSRISHRGAVVSEIAAYRWSPQAPLRRDERAPERMALGQIQLFGENVVGSLDTDRRRGLLVWGSHAPIAHALPLADLVGRGAGTLDEAGDGSIFAAFESDGTSVTLISIPAKDTPKERSFAVRRGGESETGVGVVGGRAPALLVIEDTADGGTELRRHPFGTDLALGPATAIPGTNAGGDQLAALPACAPGAKGAIVRTFVKGLSRVRVDEVETPSHLQRLLRVTDAGACVERVFASKAAGSLESLVVVSGDGSRGAATGAAGRPPGIRCEPLTTRSAEATRAPRK